MVLGGWVDGWMDEWMDGTASFRIAYSNQKDHFWTRFIKNRDSFWTGFLKIKTMPVWAVLYKNNTRPVLHLFHKTRLVSETFKKLVLDGFYKIIQHF